MMSLNYSYVDIDIYVCLGKTEKEEQESNEDKKSQIWFLNKLVSLIGRKRKKNGEEE